jgi:hypothetical protein
MVKIFEKVSRQIPLFLIKNMIASKRRHDCMDLSPAMALFKTEKILKNI